MSPFEVAHPSPPPPPPPGTVLGWAGGRGLGGPLPAPAPARRVSLVFASCPLNPGSDRQLLPAESSPRRLSTTLFTLPGDGGRGAREAGGGRGCPKGVVGASFRMCINNNNNNKCTYMASRLSSIELLIFFTKFYVQLLRKGTRASYFSLIASFFVIVKLFFFIPPGGDDG